ncbi:MAG: pilus assembly protein PilM [Thermoleophilaceae bacterium]|nr:pilus assembly protein PilM [Thermoleophilaceae bacterium]
MQLKTRKDRSTGAVGLDIDGVFLAAVQESDGRLARAASTELEPGLMTDGEVTDGTALSRALEAFFEANRLPKRVRLGVSNQQIVVRQLEMPFIDNEKDRDAAIRFQAAETIAMPLDEAILDYTIVAAPEAPEGPPRMNVVVVAARESMVRSLVEAVRGAGLRPLGIDLNAFALVRTLANRHEAAEHARVYCHLAGVTNLAIALGSNCVFTRPLSTAWDSYEDDTAVALAEEIRLSIDYYTADPDVRFAGDVVLSGPGSQREGLAEDLGRMLALTVSVADPLGNLDPGFDGMAAGEDPHRHTIAAGLAVGDLA